MKAGMNAGLKSKEKDVMFLADSLQINKWYATYMNSLIIKKQSR